MQNFGETNKKYYGIFLILANCMKPKCFVQEDAHLYNISKRSLIFARCLFLNS